MVRPGVTPGTVTSEIMTRPKSASGPVASTTETRIRDTSDGGSGARTNPLAGTPNTLATGPSEVR